MDVGRGVSADQIRKHSVPPSGLLVCRRPPHKPGNFLGQDSRGTPPGKEDGFTISTNAQCTMTTPPTTTPAPFPGKNEIKKPVHAHGRQEHWGDGGAQDY